MTRILKRKQNNSKLLKNHLFKVKDDKTHTSKESFEKHEILNSKMAVLLTSLDKMLKGDGIKVRGS